MVLTDVDKKSAFSEPWCGVPKNMIALVDERILVYCGLS
jgi:hypothetical protein